MTTETGGSGGEDTRAAYVVRSGLQQRPLLVDLLNIGSPLRPRTSPSPLETPMISRAAVRPHRIRIATLILAVLAAVAIAVPPAMAQGRELHVAPSGDDDARGTASAPWGTIYWAMEQARAGDTIYLHEGIYDERVGTLRPLPKGTPDARITLRNAPGEHPVIRGMLNVFKGGFHHWTVQGIEIVPDADLQPNEALVRLVDGVGWELRDMTIHGNRSYAAVRVMAEQSGLATNWAIRNSCIHSTAPANDVNNDHNIYVGADSRHGIAAGPGVIEGNVVHGAPNGSNVKLGAGAPDLPGTSGVTVRDNIMAGAPQNVVIAWRSHDNVVENNLLFQQHNGTWSQPWYPNVRGLDLTGKGNVARTNLGANDARVVENWGAPADVADVENVKIDLSTGPVDDPCADLRSLGGVSRLFGPDSIVDRVAGGTRTDTAAKLSARTYDTADTVVVARADQYADALAGAPLAGHVRGPLLLTDPTSLTPSTRDQIRSLGASTVYIMGGEGAISDDVETAIRALGVDVRRIAGASRFDTAAKVIDLLPSPQTVYVVEGTNPDPRRGWPDAVALAPLAASQAAPILLTGRDTLPADTRRAVRGLDEATKITIVGGATAVSSAVEQELRNAAPDGARSVERMAGNTRYETSARVALEATETADASKVWLVSGENWPDALAAGPAAAAAGATMLFVHPDDARKSPPALNWIEDRTAPDRLSLTVVGGVGAISEGAVMSLAYALD